jgi:hypothetical protein
MNVDLSNEKPDIFVLKVFYRVRFVYETLESCFNADNNDHPEGGRKRREVRAIK